MQNQKFVEEVTKNIGLLEKHIQNVMNHNPQYPDHILLLADYLSLAGEYFIPTNKKMAYNYLVKSYKFLISVFPIMHPKIIRNMF